MPTKPMDEKKGKSSLFGLPVKVLKKGKTVGRKSKMEIQASKLMSRYFEKPEVKKAMEAIQFDMLAYGVAVIPSDITKYKPRKP